MADSPVAIAFDAAHDHRTAYLFTVSAGGVLEDGLLYDDSEETSDWGRGVGRGRRDVAVRLDGGTAEPAIPLAALRFTPGASQVFRVYLERKATAHPPTRSS
jgi:hypothetical protein